MDKTEQRICWYSTALIVLAINSPKLLALRENGIIAHYWHFNLAELLLQIGFNLLFCLAFFYLNLNPFSPLAIRREKGGVDYYLFNGALFLFSIVIGGALQAFINSNHQLPQIYWAGVIGRLALSAVLMGIVIKIILLIRYSKIKDIENEQLKSAFVAAELELLKEQMNPHFLFNSLSSLSGVISENQELAQKYVRELSNVFRYSLVQANRNLVTVGEEIKMLKSFAQLITMRLEDAFILSIEIGETYLQHKLPHLSLQPLLENAVKHNVATLRAPLKVTVSIDGDYLVVSNTLKEIQTPETSNGLGLVNLSERFRIMMGQEISIFKTGELFIVKLPLKA